MTMKVLVTGATGLLGTALIDYLAPNFVTVATSRNIGYSKQGITWITADLLDKSAVRNLLTTVQPDVVIHCAALVNVDACERNPTLASDIHVGTTDTIATILAKQGGRLIYISTDSVFNGKKDSIYSELDAPDPPNIYARTKLEGEFAALIHQQSVVLRTNIFGWSRSERLSFSEWVLKGLVEGTPLSMFADMQYTPLHVSHLADLIARIIANPHLQGIYHATGSAALSKHDFALQMAAMFGLDGKSILAKSIDDAALSAVRPKNMALSNVRLCAALEYRIPEVIEGIKLMKNQYDNGWLERIKNRPVSNEYKFWEVV
jgi:dTDP-4-dehydrorhamnose reductase